MYSIFLQCYRILEPLPYDDQASNFMEAIAVPLGFALVPSKLNKCYGIYLTMCLALVPLSTFLKWPQCPLNLKKKI